MSKPNRPVRSCAATHLCRKGGAPAWQALQAGFTLIELMIVVAIVAILAAVALPSYQNYIRRGQLQEAFANLSDYRIKMEQYYQDNKSYGSSACGSDGTTPPTVGAPSWSTFAPVGAKYFTYSCTTSAVNSIASQAYTITAVNAAALGGTNQYKYTIDQTGAKGTLFYKGASSTAACWLSSSSSC
ncbi:MAG: type IV pilin protein [Pseudomonadota bacterium]